MSVSGEIDLGMSRTIAGLALLVDLAREDGLDVGRMLAGVGISPDDLKHADYEVRGKQELQVLENLLALGIDSSFAFRAGLRYRISAFGMLGYALLNCETVGDAIACCERFINLSHAWCNLRADTTPDGVVLEFGTAHLPAHFRAFAVERDMAALAMVSRDLTGRRLPLRRWCMSHAPMATPEVYAQAIRGEPEFMQEKDYWLFDTVQLQTRLPLSNPLTWQQCIRACEELLEQRRLMVGLAGSVRSMLMRHADNMPSMEEVATHLCMTPRTLRRHLLKEETTFRDIVHDVRRALAESMLLEGKLTLHDIAMRLGYQDTNSFLTAFRQWTGMTPTMFRRARRGV